MRRGLGCAMALLVWLLPGHAVDAVAQACSASAFAGDVHAAAAALSAPAPDLGRVVAQVQSLQQRYLPSQIVFTPVIDDLTTVPPDLEDARTRLNAEAAVLSLPRGATCEVDSTPARNALRDVYASPAFAGLDQSQQPSLLSRIAEFIGKLISGAARTLGTAGSLALLLTVLGGAIGFAAWRLRSSVAARSVRLGVEPRGDTSDPAVEWAAADASAGRGEYREAVRRAFRSALLSLAMHSALLVDPAWTTRELLRAVAADAALLAVLAPAAADFDEAWYSGREVTREQWDRARTRCEAVRRLAARPRAALR